MSDPQKKAFAEHLARIIIPIVILAAGIVGLGILASQNKPIKHQAPSRSLPLVETKSIAPHTGGLDIEVDGQVVPFREITISAEVAGQITFKADQCRAGRFVSKYVDGDKSKPTLLIQIDDRDYKLEVRRLEKANEQAGTSLQELDEEIAGTNRIVELAKDRVRLSKNDYRRVDDLHRRGVATDSQLDKMEQAVVASQNALMTLQNKVRLLKTRHSRLEQTQVSTSLMLEKARLALERTTIYAPIDGIVVKDSAEQGVYVRPGNPLVTIEDTSKVEVECALVMKDLYWLWDQENQPTSSTTADGPLNAYRIPETPVTVVYELEGNEYTWSGRLVRYDGGGLNERTRTVPCRVVVDQPRKVRVRRSRTTNAISTPGPRSLMRGMFVSIEIHARPKQPLFVIPESALQPGNRIWRVQDGKLEIVPVRVVRVLSSVILRSEALTDPQLQRKVFRRGVLTEALKAKLLADPVLDESTKSRLLRERAFRNESLREQTLENAVVITASDRALAAGDQVVVSPMTIVHDGMKVQVAKP